MLAQLEGSNVCGDGPPIVGCDLRRIVHHGAEAVRHYIEEVPDGRLAQAIEMERRWASEAAPYDDAQTVPDAVVTR
jgi:hypothetical protein